MSLIALIVILIVVGVLLWAVTNYIPMDPTIRRIIIAVTVLAVILFLLRAFGLLAGIERIRI